MSSMPARIAPFKYLPAQIALDPVHNILNSLALLNAADRRPGVGEWATRTAAALTSERRHAHRLVFEALRDGLTPDREWPTFPAYLDDLAAQNPAALRERLLQRVFAQAAGEAPSEGSAQAPIDVAEYVARVERLHPDTTVEPALHPEIQALLDDPPALHDLIVAHLDHMWETTLAAEWRRARGGPTGLDHQLSVFRQRLSAEATAAETFRTYTGRALPADLPMPQAHVQQIILVPSAHNGWHLSTWYGDATLRIFFGAPPNYALLLRTSAIGAAELRARLDALADDIRLRILALLAQRHELPAQEIIAQLDLSQSSVSRHLKQLSGVGYLTERRGAGANKIYSLSTLNLDATLRTLEQLVAGAYTPVENLRVELGAEHPQELRRFLDAQGRVARWPTKQRDRLLVLGYLASHFEPGRSYTEREINAMLIAQIVFEDYVSIRRELYDYRFIDREPDGSRYWRAEPVLPNQAN